MPDTARSRHRQQLLFWAVLLLLATCSLFQIYSTNHLISLTENAQKAESITNELNRFLSSVQDVETGARGYVITGNPAFLEPQERSSIEVYRSLDHLRTLTGQSGQLRHSLDMMEQRVRRRVALASALVAHRAAGGSSASLIQDVEAGKFAMDRVRAAVDAALDAERDASRGRELAIKRQANTTSLAAVAGVGLSLTVLIWLFAVRRQAEHDLNISNAELEELVETRTRDLAQSNEVLNAVIENIPDIVFLKMATDGHRYVLINRAAEHFLGIERESVLGQQDHDLFPPDQAALIQSEDAEAVDSGQPQFTAARTLSADQGLRTVESRTILISTPEGSQKYVLEIIRDLTEQKAFENQLRQIQRMDAIGHLTGGIAHDFNNILAIIIGNIELLRAQQADGSPTAEMTDEA